MWLLLIEDELRLAQSLRRCLKESGFIVDVASDGIEGEDLALLNQYDALIAAWNLPLQDGKTLIENVRRAGRRHPIIMLSANSGVEDRVAGLEAGADDFMCKPFSFEELLARLHALLRRPPVGNSFNLLQTGGLVLNLQRRNVTYKGSVLNLRPKEYLLLTLFMKHSGSILSRETIAERVWDDHLSIRANKIDVTMANLRSKLSNACPGHIKGHPDAVRITTVRGVGYSLLTA